MKHLSLAYFTTVGAIVFSLSNINLLLSTIVLLLTIGYWAKKNWDLWFSKKAKGEN